MMNFKVALLSASLTMCACACGGTASPDQPEAALVADGVYTNEYFGLTLPIPDGWHVASDENGEYVREVGERVAAGDDAAMKAVIDSSKKRSFQLLMLSEHEMGAPVDFNPNLVLTAERVSHLPGIQSGGDYLVGASKLLMRTPLPYEVVREPYSVPLGDRQWYRADFLINRPEMPIHQSYFSTKQDDFVLSIILSAADEAQMRTLEEIAAGVVLE